MKIVLDTNNPLLNIPKRSSHFGVGSLFSWREYTLCVNNEILEEYTEMLQRFLDCKDTTREVAKTSFWAIIF